MISSYFIYECKSTYIAKLFLQREFDLHLTSNFFVWGINKGFLGDLEFRGYFSFILKSYVLIFIIFLNFEKITRFRKVMGVSVGRVIFYHSKFVLA